MLKAEEIVFQKQLTADRHLQDSKFLSSEIGEVKPKQIQAKGQSPQDNLCDSDSVNDKDDGLSPARDNIVQPPESRKIFTEDDAESEQHPDKHQNNEEKVSNDAGSAQKRNKHRQAQVR